MTPLSAEFLLSQGQCCGMDCINCPYEPRQTTGATAIAPPGPPRFKFKPRDVVMTPHGLGTIVNQDRVTTHPDDPLKEADGMVTLNRYGVRHDKPVYVHGRMYPDNIMTINEDDLAQVKHGHVSERKNLEFRITWMENNLRYLLGEPTPNEVRASVYREMIVIAKRELATLKEDEN